MSDNPSIKETTLPVSYSATQSSLQDSTKVEQQSKQLTESELLQEPGTAELEQSLSKVYTEQLQDTMMSDYNSISIQNVATISNPISNPVPTITNQNQITYPVSTITEQIASVSNSVPTIASQIKTTPISNYSISIPENEITSIVQSLSHVNDVNENEFTNTNVNESEVTNTIQSGIYEGNITIGDLSLMVNTASSIQCSLSSSYLLLSKIIHQVSIIKTVMDLIRGSDPDQELSEINDLLQNINIMITDLELDDSASSEMLTLIDDDKKEEIIAILEHELAQRSSILTELQSIGIQQLQQLDSMLQNINNSYN